VKGTAKKPAKWKIYIYMFMVQWLPSRGAGGAAV